MVVLLMVGLIWVWKVDVLFRVWDEFLCWGYGGIGFSLW